MTKSKIFVILSVAVLLFLMVQLVLRPLIFERGDNRSVSRESLTKTTYGYIIQLDVFNDEGKDQHYRITMDVDGEISDVGVMVRNGGKYTYVRQIHFNMIEEGRCTYDVYRGGESAPFEHGTAYLKKPVVKANTIQPQSPPEDEEPEVQPEEEIEAQPE